MREASDKDWSPVLYVYIIGRHGTSMWNMWPYVLERWLGAASGRTNRVRGARRKKKKEDGIQPIRKKKRKRKLLFSRALLLYREKHEHRVSS